MRTVNFRDGVLHAVAYKLGLDPDQSNFLTNQAIPIGTYIDEWVRRVYDSRDWPAWVVTTKFPTVHDSIEHFVPYEFDQVTNGHVHYSIGRVLKVFLVDPDTTDSPVDTPFTLIEDGIHVGFEHGSNVWIRYLNPPPRFTAVSWLANSTYAKDDVAYSYTTGECYKSKVNNNFNHDPASEGSPTPPPPQSEIVQPWTRDNLGVAERTGILTISFTSVATDPPVSGSEFILSIVDGDAVSIGNASHTASGAESLTAIITALATDLGASLGGTFVVSSGFTSITVEDNSIFAVNQATYRESTTAALRLGIHYEQAYLPDIPTVVGLPQITRISMTAGTTFPGATYTLTVIGSSGSRHSVDYESELTDGAQQILQGLILAVEASTDTAFQGVQLSLDTALLTLDVSIYDNASVDVVVTVEGSAYWELVPFPKVIADAVSRGAYADLLKEWTQTDKGAAEEQAVPTEIATSEGDFASTPNPELTGQQRSLSRYKV